MTKMILGIDISKKSFDVHLQNEKQTVGSRQFANTAAGHKKLGQWLGEQGAEQVRACLEATGRYGDELALYLHEQGHRVSMVNPARIKKYAESKLQRNTLPDPVRSGLGVAPDRVVKTDKMDARLIADFCRTQEPTLWRPMAPEKRELQEIVRRLSTLIAEQTRERNRQQAGIGSALVKASIEANLEFLANQITQLEKQIQSYIDQHPDLKRDQALLTSIQGIGSRTAARILGELPPVSHFDNSGQVVAYAGLSPQHHESGSSVHKRARLTKIGNQHLKTALYLPALSAIRFNPIIVAQAERLEERGKEPMVIVGAAMRKLLQLAYGVLKSGQPFDPLYAQNLQFAS